MILGQDDDPEQWVGLGGGVMGSWSGHYTTDPAELESRFAEDAGLSFLGSVFTEPTEDDTALLDYIRQALDSLPPREADFIDLYYFRKMKQTDIAAIFGVSQPTVCYRLARAAARIRFLLDIPKMDPDQLLADLESLLLDPLDIQVMMLMWETSCQSEVARRLGESQGLVRHRFLRTLALLEKHEQFADHVRLFEYISEHLIILREVQRSCREDDVLFCVR